VGVNRYAVLPFALFVHVLFVHVFTMRLADGIIQYSLARGFREEMRMQQKKKCFVIMPVSKTKSCTTRQWTTIFNEMIRQAVAGSRLGFTCERSKPRTGNLIRDILNELNKADVVIADLTDTNPNVFYELGVRHTLRNRTILVAQDMKYVPSDLRSYWVIIYNKGLSGLQDFKNKIREVLKEMMKNPEKPDSPVADFLGERNISLLLQERAGNLRKLTALVGELSYNISLVDTVLSTVKKSEEARKKKQPQFVSTVRFANGCLSLLLSTRYIEFPRESLEGLTNLNSVLLSLNANLDLWRDSTYSNPVEKTLKQQLPTIKNSMGQILKQQNQVRLDYMNDNYQEETMPVLLLSSEEHKQYIEST